jgi:hypothetical protein
VWNIKDVDLLTTWAPLNGSIDRSQMPVVVAAPPEHIRKARNHLSMLPGDVYEAIEAEEELDAAAPSREPEPPQHLRAF